MSFADFSFAFAEGLALGAGLIIAIGAQNAFVLAQGLKRRRVLAVAMTCSLCDASLIALGVGGIGPLVMKSESLIFAATWGGAVFLLTCGLFAFKSAMKPRALSPLSDSPIQSAGRAIAAALAFSLLNPHVYLDTVILIGGLSGRYPLPPRIFFGLGAITASFVWFFALAFGASVLAPLFAKPKAWQILDAFVGLVMTIIALGLILSAI